MEHLTFAVERFADIAAELAPLFQRHWEELALDKEAVPLDPDWRRYHALEAEGILSVVAARQNGRLVGYSFMCVARALHYHSTLEATMDIFWLASEVRGRMGGVRLFRAVEKELRRRGVKRVYVGSKMHKDSSPLFLRLGYAPIETWFSKLLED